MLPTKKNAGKKAESAFHPPATQQGMVGEIWLSDDQPHPDYNGQWQRGLCIVAVRQSSQPNQKGNACHKTN